MRHHSLNEPFIPGLSLVARSYSPPAKGFGVFGNSACEGGTLPAQVHYQETSLRIRPCWTRRCWCLTGLIRLLKKTIMSSLSRLVHLGDTSLYPLFPLSRPPLLVLRAFHSSLPLLPTLTYLMFAIHDEQHSFRSFSKPTP